jgi:hypothetical protein
MIGENLSQDQLQENNPSLRKIKFPWIQIIVKV